MPVKRDERTPIVSVDRKPALGAEVSGESTRFHAKRISNRLADQGRTADGWPSPTGEDQAW